MRDATRTEQPARVVTLDALRGVAVVLMVAWHASDGWLRAEHHAGAAWALLRTAGGLAAPLFLLAAGVAVGLGARRGRGLSRVIVRGVELVVLGHALRLAQWAIDRGAIVQPRLWPALILGVCFVLAALGTLRGSRRARALAVLAALFASAHVISVLLLGPSLARIVLRFDVLHCIGVSCVACALVAYNVMRLARRAPSLAWAPAVILAVSALVVVSLPIAAELDRAGGTLAWIARGPELRRFAPFPLVPWTGYALLGCAAALAPIAWPERRTTTLLVFFVAIAIAFASFEGGFVFRWSELGAVTGVRPLARLAFHAGAAVAIACALSALARSRAGEVLAITGRASLVIYALHLFVAYGKLGGLVARSLDPLACAALVTVLIAICIGGALLAARRRRGGECAHTVRAHVGSSANSSA
jgi:uncharacterized membrane protein